MGGRLPDAVTAHSIDRMAAEASSSPAAAPPGWARRRRRWSGTARRCCAASCGIVGRAVDGPVDRRAGARARSCPRCRPTSRCVDDAARGARPAAGPGGRARPPRATRAEVAFVCSTDLPFLHPAFVASRSLARACATDARRRAARTSAATRSRSPRPTGPSSRRWSSALVAADRLRPAFLFEDVRVLRLDERRAARRPGAGGARPELDSVLNVNKPADYEPARARPAPEVDRRVLRRAAPRGGRPAPRASPGRDVGGAAARASAWPSTGTCWPRSTATRSRATPRRRSRRATRWPSCPRTPAAERGGRTLGGMAPRRLLRPGAGRRRRRRERARRCRCPTGAARLPRRRRARRLAACTELAPPGVDPLGARRRRSPSCFSPLVGTPLTTSAKFAVVAKSPLTGMLNDALASSHFAIAGKLTGHDAIVVARRVRRAVGAARRRRRRAARAAPATCGACSAADAEARLRERLGPAWRVAAIGPAGERLVRYATVSHDGRHAGRGGLGAVLGAKNMKAVAVRAATKVRAGRPAGGAGRGQGPARALVRAGHREVPRARHAGQPARVQRALDPAHPQLPGRHLRRARRRSPRRSWPSPRRRPRQLRLLHDRLRAHLQRATAARTTRVEYENVFALGPMCGVSRPRRRAARRARRCDELGLDTISAGGTIAWAMECAERGLLDAPWLRFGDGDGAAARARRDRRARGARRRCSPRARGARPPRSSARARPPSPRTSRASSCPATSRARCTRWRSAWRSTPAAPTTTAPAPTRPTCPGDLDRLDGGAAARRRRDRDRGPRGGHGLADPVQVPARRLRPTRAPSGPRCSRRSPAGTSTPPSCTTTARRIVLAKRAFNLREGWTRAEDTAAGAAARGAAGDGLRPRRPPSPASGCARWSTATARPGAWTRGRLPHGARGPAGVRRMRVTADRRCSCDRPTPHRHGDHRRREA